MRGAHAGPLTAQRHQFSRAGRLFCFTGAFGQLSATEARCGRAQRVQSVLRAGEITGGHGGIGFRQGLPRVLEEQLRHALHQPRTAQRCQFVQLCWIEDGDAAGVQECRFAARLAGRCRHRFAGLAEQSLTHPVQRLLQLVQRERFADEVGHAGSETFFAVAL